LGGARNSHQRSAGSSLLHASTPIATRFEYCRHCRKLSLSSATFHPQTPLRTKSSSACGRLTGGTQWEISRRSFGHRPGLNRQGGAAKLDTVFIDRIAHGPSCSPGGPPTSRECLHHSSRTRKSSLAFLCAQTKLVPPTKSPRDFRLPPQKKGLDSSFDCRTYRQRFQNTITDRFAGFKGARGFNVSSSTFSALASHRHALITNRRGSAIRGITGSTTPRVIRLLEVLPALAASHVGG